MRYPILGLLAVLAGPTLVQPVHAQEDTSSTVARSGDETMTCVQMADEAAALSAAMGSDRPGVFGVVSEVARSGAAMLVPGAGLAMAGADVLTRPGRERREEKTAAGRDRWNYLNGLYAGRGCNSPQLAAMKETAPAAVPVASVASPSAARAPATAPLPRIVVGTLPLR